MTRGGSRSQRKAPTRRTPTPHLPKPLPSKGLFVMLFFTQIVMAGWMLAVLIVLTIVVIDIAAERLRERRKRIDFRKWQRELEMDRHPASRCFVTGERR